AGPMELFAHPPHRRRPSLDSRRVGSCIACFGACTAFTFVTACKLAKSPNVTLYTRGFSSFVTSTTAPIATGRSEPVPGRDFPRCGPAPFTEHWKTAANRVLYTEIYHSNRQSARTFWLRAEC